MNPFIPLYFIASLASAVVMYQSARKRKVVYIAVVGPVILMEILCSYIHSVGATWALAVIDAAALITGSLWIIPRVYVRRSVDQG